jgi:ribosomal protein S18 acetylase RimI-like enzyme
MAVSESYGNFTSKSASKFSIRLARESEAIDVLNFHNSFFINVEPMQVAHPKQYEASDDVSFYLDSVKQKLTLLVFDEFQKLVGFLMAKVSTLGDSENLRESAKSLGDCFDADILNFLAFIEDKSDILTKFHLDECLQIFMISVHPDYRNQSIATKLFEAAFTMAKLRSFDLISVDCTSKFTSNIAEKLSMDLISTVTYDEYNNHLGRQLFTLLPPHTDIRTFVKAL